MATKGYPQTLRPWFVALPVHGMSVSASILNRSQNPESIIGRVFDSIIDFKSILGQIYREILDGM